MTITQTQLGGLPINNAWQTGKTDAYWDIEPIDFSFNTNSFGTNPYENQMGPKLSFNRNPNDYQSSYEELKLHNGLTDYLYKDNTIEGIAETPYKKPTTVTIEQEKLGDGLSGQAASLLTKQLGTALYQPLDMTSNIMLQSRHSGSRVAGALIKHGVGSVAGKFAAGMSKSIAQLGAKALTKEGLKTAFNSGIKGIGGMLKGSNGAGLAMGLAGTVMDAWAGPRREASGKYGSTYKTAETMYDAATTAMSWNPIVSGIMGLNKGITSVLNKWGGGTDGMTRADALLASSFVGPLGAINGWTGATVKNADNTDWISRNKLDSLWSAYASTHEKYNKALNDSGKKFGGVSVGARHRAEDNIQETDIATNKLKAMVQNNEVGQTRGQYMQDLKQNEFNLDSNGLRVDRLYAKKGRKLPTAQDLQLAKRIVRSQKKIETHKQGGVIPLEPIQNIGSFKKGGSLNLIPEGALHARKNNMNVEGITKKGIPVVDKEGDQQAEIELNEIIFRKEVTDKLEELAQDGSEKAALEAGKLLVKEIFENTDDRTGLIAELTNEKKVEEHKVFLNEATKESKLKLQQGGSFTQVMNSFAQAKNNMADAQKVQAIQVPQAPQVITIGIEPIATYHADTTTRPMMAQEGGTLDTMAKNIIEQNKDMPWIKRLFEDTLRVIPDFNAEGNYASHKLGWDTAEDKIIIYPHVQEINNELHDFENPKYNHDKFDALHTAIDNHNAIILQDTPENRKFAEWFTDNNYKKYFKSTESIYNEWLNSQNKDNND